MASRRAATFLRPLLGQSRLRAPRYPLQFLDPPPGRPLASRFAHTIPKPPRPTAAGESDPDASSPILKRLESQPHYKLAFTCVPCGQRSNHTISKQGYHHGSVLITCPSCRNRHVISDHLKIFGDRRVTVEDLMREKGQLVKKGTLGEDGNIEFWADDRQADDAAAVDGAEEEKGKGGGS